MNQHILREKIVSQERRIAAIIKDGEAQEKRLRAEIENSTMQGYSPKHIAQLKENLSAYINTRDSILSRARGELSAMQGEHSEAEARSIQIQSRAHAVHEANMKNQAASRWVGSGGDPAEFEQAWPALKQRIISEQVVESMVSSQPSPRTITL